MANIVPQYRQINCNLDGKILYEKIEEFNVPDLKDANACPLLNFELKVRGYEEILAAVGKAAGKAAGNPMQLEIWASIENNYGETGQASWKCRGIPIEDIPTTPMPTTTLKLNAVFYEHIINGEEKYYIDILNDIRRIDGKDRLTAIGI